MVESLRQIRYTAKCAFIKVWMSGYKSTTKSNPRLIGENINVNVTVIIVLYQEVGKLFSHDSQTFIRLYPNSSQVVVKLASGYSQLFQTNWFVFRVRQQQEATPWSGPCSKPGCWWSCWWRGIKYRCFKTCLFFLKFFIY